MSSFNSPTFGAWLRTRRRALDLTQKQLATQAECAEITIRKIEANDLRPSKGLTQTLLKKLNVPRAEQADLMLRARERIG